MKIMPHPMLMPADVKQAFTLAPAIVGQLPETPRDGALYSHLGDYSIRLCTRRGEPSGGAVLTLWSKGLRLERRVKNSRRGTIVRTFTRMQRAAHVLSRLIQYREQCAKVCDSYYRSQDRQHKARLLRLSRKLTGLPGLDGISYENFDVPTCEAMIQFCEED